MREGLRRQALYSDYWGHTWTGDGIAADAFNATYREAEDDLEMRRSLVDAGITEESALDELTDDQQKVVVDVLLHYIS